MATPSQRCRTACGSPARAADGITVSNKLLIRGTTRIFRIGISSPRSSCVGAAFLAAHEPFKPVTRIDGPLEIFFIFYRDGSTFCAPTPHSGCGGFVTQSSFWCAPCLRWGIDVYHTRKHLPENELTRGRSVF